MPPLEGFSSAFCVAALHNPPKPSDPSTLESSLASLANAGDRVSGGLWIGGDDAVEPNA